ncbi:ATP-binding cassette domain-containing protein|uniref:ATP-binding cassette domain-containing protein n=1 Tax=Leuconostoc lactis TaxID=1246 RepID=A0A6L7A7A6_LEULA|nr:ATP-binding cassette domain-containing protein [Leuconostoc lactis]
MDLLAIADQRLGLVSGGQKQRAFVAQALVQQPDLLILDEANIDIPAGRFFAILGENGAGKTSFVKALIGQNVQTVGQLSRQVKRIGFVPQFRDITRDYPLQISELVSDAISSADHYF